MADDKPRSVDELAGPTRHFAIKLEDRLRALDGLPAHILRRRSIEDGIAKALGALRALRAAGAGRGELHEAAVRLDVRALNVLVDKHNRFYPIEANLPMDPVRRCILEAGQPWEPLPQVTAERLLALLDEP